MEEHVMTVGDSYQIRDSCGGENFLGQYSNNSKKVIPEIPTPDQKHDWELITAIPKLYPCGRQYIQYIWRRQSELKEDDVL